MVTMSMENCSFHEMMYCNENLLDLEPYIMNMKNNGNSAFDPKNNTSNQISSTPVPSPFKTRRKLLKPRLLYKKEPEVKEADYCFDIQISDEVFYQIEEFLKKEDAIQ